jgi:ferredoxin
MTDNTMAKRKSIKEKDKQRSTKHIYKNNDRVTRTQLKTGGELGCSGRVGSSCGTCHVNLVTNPVIGYE